MANPQKMTTSLGSSPEDSVDSYAHLKNMEWGDLADVSLLATLLSLAFQGEGAVLQAETILRSAGSLNGLVKMSTSELSDLLSKNPKAIAFINLLRLGLHRIVSERTSDQIWISSPKAMAEYVAIHRNPAVGGNRRVVLLDRDSRLIRDFSLPVSETDLTCCRKIAQTALKADASGIIIIEYLYKDDLYFSPKFNNLFQIIQESMKNINIHLYDYLLVGMNRYFSKKQNMIVNLYEI